MTDAPFQPLQQDHVVRKKPILNLNGLLSWGKWSQVEHPHHLNTLYFTHRIEFPQREQLTEMTAIHS